MRKEIGSTFGQDEMDGVNKRDSEECDGVNATVQLRMEMVACRDKLDLEKAG